MRLHLRGVIAEKAAVGSKVEQTRRKGFERVTPSAGDTKTVRFHLPVKALACCQISRAALVMARPFGVFGGDHYESVLRGLWTIRSGVAVPPLTPGSFGAISFVGWSARVDLLIRWTALSPDVPT